VTIPWRRIGGALATAAPYGLLPPFFPGVDGLLFPIGAFLVVAVLAYAFWPAIEAARRDAPLRPTARRLGFSAAVAALATPALLAVVWRSDGPEVIRPVGVAATFLFVAYHAYLAWPNLRRRQPS